MFLLNKIYLTRCKLLNIKVYCCTILAKDSCAGDSGGPLLVSKKKGMHTIYTIAGLTSWGPTECGSTPNEYGIYERVSHHNKWILDHLD